MQSGKTIELVLNDAVLDKYYSQYFEKYPKRSKRYIDRPIHPSINKWMILQRQAMNALKQHWHDFMVWWINDLGLNDTNIDQFEVTFKTYMPTKRRCDPDNTVPKFILDGFTDSGFIMDDSGDHLKSLTLMVGYDKENPRTEIQVRIL